VTAPDPISPSEVIAFWREADAERWWKKDDAFDDTIRARFLALWHEAAAGGLRPWRASDEGMLALIIVCDQFPRNMFRGDPRTYATDPLAIEVAREAVDAGVDLRVDPSLRQFIYMPFMHSEHLADQERCVALFRDSGDAENGKYAEDHADIVRRFGRFPHRNQVLGRATTAEEQAFLDSGGFSG
jgi:uncharacterized protein (DUF924 family)